jgi:hypothetical protein
MIAVLLQSDAASADNAQKRFLVKDNAELGSLYCDLRLPVR